MIDENTPRCGAKLRNKDKTCRRLAMRNAEGGFGRCAIHGGLSLRGTAHPRFKTGARSKVLTTASVMQRFGRLLTDRNDSNQARAILQLQIEDLVSQLQDNSQMWRDAKESFFELKELLSEENAIENRAVEVNALMAQLEISLQGGRDTEARAKLPDLLDKQTKILERQIRQEVLARQMYTVEEVLLMVALNRDLIARFVPDDMRQEFEEAYSRVFNANAKNFVN